MFETYDGRLKFDDILSRFMKVSTKYKASLDSMIENRDCMVEIVGFCMEVMTVWSKSKLLAG